MIALYKMDFVHTKENVVMKKRLLALLLIFVMLVGMAPMAFGVEMAEEEHLQIEAYSNQTVQFRFSAAVDPSVSHHSPFLEGAIFVGFRDGVEAFRRTVDPLTGRQEWVTTIGNTREFRIEIIFPSGWRASGFHGSTITTSTPGNPNVRLISTDDIVNSDRFWNTRFELSLGWDGIPPNTEPPVLSGTPFTDMNASTFYTSAVRWVYQQNLMNGTSSTTFEPGLPLDRAMLATVLHRHAGLPNANFRSVFTDVASGRWYSQGIIWASDNSIVNGVGDNRFAPNQTLSRQELAVMIHRFAISQGHNVSVPSSVQAPSGTASWATEAMRWAVHNNFLPAHGGAPSGQARRGDTALFLYRFAN